MKNILIGLVAGVLLVGVALGVAGVVSAQTTTPTVEDGTGVCPMGNEGRGMMGAQGGTCPVTGEARGTGAMHDLMVSAFAGQLGITPEELQAELDAGKTMYQVALDKGLTQEQFVELKQTSRAAALDEAVAQGLLTQEQADLMKQRGSGMMGNGTGMGGNCPMLDGDETGTRSFGGGMMRGRGMHNTQP